MIVFVLCTFACVGETNIVLCSGELLLPAFKVKVLRNEVSARMARRMQSIIKPSQIRLRLSYSLKNHRKNKHPPGEEKKDINVADQIISPSAGRPQTNK